MNQLRTYINKLDYIVNTYGDDYGVHIQTDEMRQMARNIMDQYLKEEATVN